MWPFRRRRRETPDFAVVLETGSASTVALAEAALDGSGIKYGLQNDRGEDLFGWGRLGVFNQVVGPVRVLVAVADAESARMLLSDIQESRQPIPRVVRWLMLVLFLAIPTAVAIVGFLRR